MKEMKTLNNKLIKLGIKIKYNHQIKQKNNQNLELKNHYYRILYKNQFKAIE